MHFDVMGFKRGLFFYSFENMFFIVIILKRIIFEIKKLYVLSNTAAYYLGWWGVSLKIFMKEREKRGPAEYIYKYKYI